MKLRLTMVTLALSMGGLLGVVAYLSVALVRAPGPGQHQVSNGTGDLLLLHEQQTESGFTCFYLSSGGTLDCYPTWYTVPPWEYDALGP